MEAGWPDWPTYLRLCLEGGGRWRLTKPDPVRSCFQAVKKSMILAGQLCLRAGEELVVMDCEAW